MPKNNTQFGKIMNLLNINPVNFSEYLHIDRTTISKWRSGGRKLLPQSPYFEPILTYFIKMDEESMQRPLITFLSSQFPQENIHSSQQTYEYLKRYLSTPLQDTPICPPARMGDDSAIQVYIGIEGRRTAFDFVLDRAEEMVLPGTIKILELEQMTWLCRDMVYMQSVIVRLKRLADRNFQIEFAFSSLQSQPTFLSFLLMLNEIRFHKNISKYVVDTDRIQGILPRIYLLCDNCVAVGLDSAEPSLPIHTNFFTDALNTYKHSKLFDRVVQLFGNKVMVTDTGNEIDHMLQMIEFLNAKKGEVMFSSSQLSITTMSQSLLFEILSDNNIQGNARARCLLYYQSLRQAMANASQNALGAYYFNLNNLQNSLSYDYVIEYELSALTNRQIHKTPGQYRRHIADTINFLEEHDHLRILLLSGGSSPDNLCVWLKKDLWSLAFNTVCVPDEYQVIFWDNPDLVNMSLEVCFHYMKNSYTVEHKKKEYNLNVLRSLSNGERI